MGRGKRRARKSPRQAVVRRGGLAPMSDSSSSMASTQLRSLPGQLGDAARFFNPRAGRPIPRLVGLQQAITVVMWQAPIDVVTDPAVDVFGGVYFRLSDFYGNAEYTSLFDQYRIRQIEVWMEPGDPGSTAAAPDLSTCVDLDDAANPTGYTNILAKQMSLRGNSMSARYHRWTPHIAVSAYTSTFSGFENQIATWIDCGSNTVQHYGFKYGVEPSSTTYAFRIHARFLVDFRAPGI